MSRVLPKELRTRKLKSLPDELSKIAEELLADKFGIEEEVVEQSTASFRQGFPGDAGFATFQRVNGRDVFIDPYLQDRLRDANRGYRDEITTRIEPWASHPVAELRVSDPSMRGLMEAIKRFKYANIRHINEFVMSPGFLDELRYRDRDFDYYFSRAMRRAGPGEKDVIGQIMGVDVIVTPRIDGCSLFGVF